MLDDMMRQRDAEVAENARLTALLAELDAEVARLREAAVGLSRWDDGEPCFCRLCPETTDDHEPCCLEMRAALAARGGEVRG